MLLNLLLCALARLETPLPRALQTVYVASPEALAGVDSFVNESVAAYRLDLTRYDLPKKDAFKAYLEGHSKVKAIMVGARRSDLHGQTLTHFDQTEPGWPAYVRVHPIVDWGHDEISAVSLHLLVHQEEGDRLMCPSLFNILRYRTVRSMAKTCHQAEL